MGIVEVEGDEPGTTRLITNQPEIENQINEFYKNLYSKRETKSEDSDLQGFMGNVGYNSFKDSAKKIYLNIYMR